MEQYRKLLVAATRTAAATALAASALTAVPAHATPGSGFVGNVEWEGPFGDIDVTTESGGLEVELKTKGNSVVVVTRNAIAPGGTSGWHTHPGPSLVTVTLGEITLYDAALCTPTRLGVGQTFVDQGGDHVHLVRNETASPAEASAVQIMPRGVPRRVDAPRPANCEPTVQ